MSTLYGREGEGGGGRSCRNAPAKSAKYASLSDLRPPARQRARPSAAHARAVPRQNPPPPPSPSLPYKVDTSRPSLRTNRTRFVPLRLASPEAPRGSARADGDRPLRGEPHRRAVPPGAQSQGR